MKFFIYWFGFVALLAWSRAETTIVFDVEKEFLQKDEEAEKAQFEFAVVLGETYFEHTNEEETLRYDFEEATVTVLKSSGDVSVQSSLYSIIGFRDMELGNRVVMGQVLEKAAVDESLFERPVLEHLFSLRTENSIPLESRLEGDESVFFYKEKQLARISSEVVEISEKELDRFLLFFRYFLRGHPDILDTVEYRGGIPKEFEIAHYDFGEEHYHLQFKNISRSDARLLEIEGAISPLAEEELAKVLRGVAEYSEKDYKAECDKLLTDAVQAAEKGELLDSALLFLGQSLAVGGQLAPEFFKFKDQLIQDVEVSMLMSSLSPASKEEAEQAVENLQNLLEKADKGRPILKIFLANNFTAFKRTAEAKQLFLETLSAYPCIVGVWKDLGDIYYRSYETSYAWQCWDAARQLNPSHKMLEPVNQFEMTLREKFPEYFLE